MTVTDPEPDRPVDNGMTVAALLDAPDALSEAPAAAPSSPGQRHGRGMRSSGMPALDMSEAALW